MMEELTRRQGLTAPCSSVPTEAGSPVVRLWSGLILQSARSPAEHHTVSEHSNPWHLLGHHPPQFFPKVAVFLIQKVILN